MFVDDEMVTRKGIKRTLNNRFPDYRIYLASSPEEAVMLLRKHCKMESDKVVHLEHFIIENVLSELIGREAGAGS